jgi:hypothetical protein
MSVPWSEDRDVLGEVGGNVALADQGHDLRILQMVVREKSKECSEAKARPTCSSSETIGTR